MNIDTWSKFHPFILSLQSKNLLYGHLHLALVAYNIMTESVRCGFPQLPPESFTPERAFNSSTSSKSVMLSYFSLSMASMTLLVNLYGLAVDAITVFTAGFLCLVIIYTAAQPQYVYP